MNQSIYRGGLYYADLNPAIGSEQHGIRPVLVISNDLGNMHSPTVIVAAITTNKVKPALPTHCILGANSGLNSESIILLEQIRTIDKRRLKSRVGNVIVDELAAVDRALAISVGLNGRDGVWNL